ncbi:T9SS type A sorting domain-containing protein [Hymenobacter fodinae]|uniref:T9SS type A sorting domain-containing protein n=1 Tax=Hymenobacter fodinae TaxID=2510796 RepID=A0A4Z0P3C9_9BACT|nr:T9SS type A sorting domain-containing protein [Hymenobacter fodinae]TGE04669.1 T9SS type A sorting domain-containing protein [Hymenobacter fodinae]
MTENFTTKACKAYGLSLLLTCFIGHFDAIAQAPEVRWERTLGGVQIEELNAIQSTIDGGLIVGGASHSSISGDRSQANQGTSSDFWVVKLAADGAKQWERAFGGSLEDELWSVLQTNDGGYLLGGTSYSGKSGDKSQPNKGYSDYWVIKIDAQGNKQWDRTYGGNGHDTFRSMQLTADGGFVVGGYSASGVSDDKSEPSLADPYFSSDPDYWVLKLDAQGNKQWDRTYGGNRTEWLSEVLQTTDGGYIVAGQSLSNESGNKSQQLKGTRDFWIVKLDAQGHKQWEQAYGTTGSNPLRRVRQTTDGGYILCGESTSGVSIDKTEPSKGGQDIWVVKVDANGVKQWDRSVGGSGSEVGYALSLTLDGGYLIGGPSTSGISGDKTEANLGAGDYWVVKLDAQGRKVWDRTVGGSGEDRLNSIQQLADGSIVLGGTSTSPISGSKSQASKGASDFWVAKLGSSVTVTSTQASASKGFMVYPNPASKYAVIKLASVTPQDGLRVKLIDATGRLVWQQVFSSAKEVAIPLRGCRAGLYMVSVDSPGEYSQQQRLVVE